MNTFRVVKVEADQIGVRLRLWVDDHAGQHLAVCEGGIEAEVLAMWARDVRAAQQQSEQYQLEFDQ